MLFSAPAERINADTGEALHASACAPLQSATPLEAGAEGIGKKVTVVLEGGNKEEQAEEARAAQSGISLLGRANEASTTAVKPRDKRMIEMMMGLVDFIFV